VDNFYLRELINPRWEFLHDISSCLMACTYPVKCLLMIGTELSDTLPCHVAS